MRNKKKNIFNLIDKKIILIVAVLLLVLLIQTSLSKYTQQIKHINTQESTQFYFECNIADVETKEYDITNWDGESNEEIEFYVRNYTNSLIKSEEDITYDMSINITDSEGIEITNGEEINVYIQKGTTKLTDLSNLSLLSDSSEGTDSGFSKNDYTLVIKPATGVNLRRKNI